MTTYYVNYASGNDSNAGTSAVAPVRTWNAANIGGGTFAPGDVLLFREDVVYDGSGGRVAPAFSSSPTLASPFTVATYDAAGNMGTGRAILDGGFVRDIGFRPSVAIDQANGPRYLRVSNLEIRKYTSNGLNIGEVSADGTHLNGSILRNLHIHDIAGASEAALKSWGTDLQVIDCVVNDVAGDGIYLEGARYVVRSCDLRRVSNTKGGLGDCVQINGTGSTDGIVEHCYLDHSNNDDKQALLLMGARSIARYNTILGFSVGGGLLTVDQAADNRIYGNLLLGRDGIYLLNSTAPCYVTANVIIAASTAGVDDDGDATGIDANNQGHFYYNNTIVGMRRGIYGQGNTCRNNIIKDCTVVGLYAGTGVVAETNNCLYGNAVAKMNNLSQSVALDASDLTVDPQLDSAYRPQNAALRGAGTYLGGLDFNGKEFRPAPTIGAVEYFPSRSLITRAIVSSPRTFISRRAKTRVPLRG